MINTGTLRKLAEAATPGPWWIDSHGMVLSSTSTGKTVLVTSERMGESKRNEETGCLSRWPNDHDASYIAAADPKQILTLLDEIDQLRTALAEPVVEPTISLPRDMDEDLYYIVGSAMGAQSPDQCERADGVWRKLVARADRDKARQPAPPPPADVRELLIHAAALAVMAYRRGIYKSAPHIADHILEVPGTPKFTGPADEPPPAGAVLEDIEQYRVQMAVISTAALGYWKDGDGIHPNYDTVPLRDVAKLYAKYDALYKAAHKEPEKEVLQFLTDVVTAAGLLEHGKQSKALAERISNGAFSLRPIFAAPHHQQPSMHASSPKSACSTLGVHDGTNT